MEENGMELEVPGYGGDGEMHNSDEDTTEPKLSTTSWILDTGLSLGKKVVITGAVISSLPLLLPPLLVISALGCSLSLPFGVVFASYACTYNLMSKLLPSPQPHTASIGHDYAEFSNIEDRELNLNVGGSRVDVTSDAQIDKLADKEERDHFSEDKNEKVILATVNKDNKDSKGKSSSKEIERWGKRKLLEGDEIHGKLSEEEKGLTLKETDTSATQGSSGQSPEIVVQELSKLGSKSSDKEGCIMLGSEINIRKQASTGSDILLNEKEEKPVGVKEMLETQSVKVGAIDDVCPEVNIEESVVSNDGENYNQSKKIAGDNELIHDEVIHEVKEAKVACAVGGGGHSDEVLFGEEKVWRKMEAIRVIVGYKAPRSASYLEELNALYVFTGIEPPSDSAKFDNKLSFLMSVIGLK